MTLSFDKFTDEYLGGIVLSRGEHKTSTEHCGTEWLAKETGAKHSDNPPCLHGKGTLRRTIIGVNDRAPDEVLNSVEFKRAILACYAADAGRGVETKRAFRLADWTVRECVPIVLESAGNATGDEKLLAHAASLRALRPVTDPETAREAQAAANYAANAANYAAYAVANAAYYAANAAKYAAKYAANYAADYAANHANYAANAAANAAEAAADIAANAGVWHKMIELLNELAAMKSGEP